MKAELTFNVYKKDEDGLFNTNTDKVIAKRTIIADITKEEYESKYPQIVANRFSELLDDSINHFSLNIVRPIY